MSLVHSASLHTQPGSAKTVADILTAAADLIEPEGAWTQRAYARDRDGEDIEDRSSYYEDEPEFEAVCYCAIGAIMTAAGERPDRVGQDDMGALEVFACFVGEESIHIWNDNPERTQAEVVAALRAAAEKARTAVEGPSVGTQGEARSEPKTLPTNGDSQ